MEEMRNVHKIFGRDHMVDRHRRTTIWILTLPSPMSGDARSATLLNQL